MHTHNKQPDDYPTPLELLNLYYSDGQTTGNKTNRLWRKVNSLLSWENIIEHQYQSDLCPLLYFIITKALPKLNTDKLHLTNLSDIIVPDTVLAVLEKHYQASLLRNMILLEELKRVLTELKNHDIRAVVLKGGYLAENVYDNIACRPMGDLDILIMHQDRNKCYEVFHSMGYRHFQQTNDRNMLIHKNYYKDFLNQRILVEVHHRLAQDWQITNFDTEKILIASHMSTEELLGYLAWHAISHGVARIIWLCDLAQIIRNDNHSITIRNVYMKSEMQNVSKRFRFTINLLSNLFGEDFLKDGRKNFINPREFFSEVLLYKIQSRILSQKSIESLRKSLTLSLISKLDIPQSIMASMRHGSIQAIN